MGVGGEGVDAFLTGVLDRGTALSESSDKDIDTELEVSSKSMGLPASFAGSEDVDFPLRWGTADVFDEFAFGDPEGEDGSAPFDTVGTDIGECDMLPLVGYRTVRAFPAEAGSVALLT